MTTHAEAIKTLEKILDDAWANATTYNLADALEVQARHNALKLALAALKGEGTRLPEAVYKHLVRGHTLRVLTPTAALGKYAADMTTVIEGEKIQGNHELTPEAAIDALAAKLKGPHEQSRNR